MTTDSRHPSERARINPGRVITLVMAFALGIIVGIIVDGTDDEQGPVVVYQREFITYVDYVSPARFGSPATICAGKPEDKYGWERWGCGILVYDDGDRPYLRDTVAVTIVRSEDYDSEIWIVRPAPNEGYPGDDGYGPTNPKANPKGNS